MTNYSDLNEVDPKERKEYLEKCRAWLMAKWGNECKCPYCGTMKWDVANELGGIFTFDGTEFEQRYYPVFAVTCVNCGQMVLVHAETAKVVDIGEEGK